MENVFETITGQSFDLLSIAAPWSDQLRLESAFIIKNYIKRLKGKKVVLLEPGAGNGKNTSLFLAMDQRIRVDACDSSQTMVNQFKIHDSRVKITCMDAIEWLQSLPGNSADIFFGGWFIHNLPPVDRIKLFEELGRVMKPGALYVNCDIVARDDKEQYRQDVASQVKDFLNLVKFDEEAAKHWAEHCLADSAPEMSFTETEQRRLLKENGFSAPYQHARIRLELLVTSIKNPST